MRKPLLTAIIAAGAIVGLSPIAQAMDDYRPCVYVYASDGSHVRDSSGDCVRTGAWDPQYAVEECDPDLFKKPEPKMEAPKTEPYVETISLGADAYFDFDKATLKPAGKARLDELAANIHNVELRSILIVGHTDSIGTDAYNQGLSERRAATVRRYLVDKGVPGSIIETRGMGESQPIASNKTREGRAKNRRVEVTVKGRRQVEQ